MWYSVVNPRGVVPNKVIASFHTWSEADDFSYKCDENSPFFVISTPTKPAIGEVVDPNDLTEDERW